MVKEECVLDYGPHLCEYQFFYGRSVCVDAFTPLWCVLELEEASVGVLGSGLYGFSLDGLNYVVDGYVLEVFFVTRSSN